MYIYDFVWLDDIGDKLERKHNVDVDEVKNVWMR